MVTTFQVWKQVKTAEALQLDYKKTNQVDTQHGTYISSMGIRADCQQVN